MGHLILFLFILGLCIGWTAITITLYFYYYLKKEYLKWFAIFLIGLNFLILLDMFFEYFSLNLVSDLSQGTVEIFHLIKRVTVYITIVIVYFSFYQIGKKIFNNQFFSRRSLSLFLLGAVLTGCLLGFFHPGLLEGQSIPDYLAYQFFILYGQLICVYLTLRALKLTKSIQDQSVRKKLETAYRFFLCILIILFGLNIIFFGNILQRNIEGLIVAIIYILLNVAPIMFMKDLVLNISVRPGSGNEIELTNLFKKICSKYGVSNREQEIIRLICEGKNNREISELLYIEPQSVKDHNYRIYQKFNINNRYQLIKIFLKSSGYSGIQKQ